MLPFYLLKDDSGWRHPRYIEQSNLAQNLCDKTSLRLIIHISRDIQDGIDNVLNYIASDKNNMAQQRSSVIPRGKTIMHKKTKRETRKQWEPIEIENFYLLKTAQSLIEETVEMMHQ